MPSFLLLTWPEWKSKWLYSDSNSFDVKIHFNSTDTHGCKFTRSWRTHPWGKCSWFWINCLGLLKVIRQKWENIFNKTYTFLSLSGSIHGEFPVPKPQTDCLRHSHRLEEPWTRHARWKCMEEYHQEATEKEVESPDCCRLALEKTLIFQCSFFILWLIPVLWETSFLFASLCEMPLQK